jgi:RecB family exonuclease
MTFLPIKASFGGVDAPHLQHSWDSSSLSTFLRCPRRYFYNYVCNFRPRAESFDLVFGSLVHAALEEYHLERQTRGHNEAQVLGLQVLLQEAFVNGKYWESNSRNKNLWNALRAFVWHTEQFALEPDFRTTVLGKKLLAVELPFSFDLDLKVNGTPATFCGHLDRMVDTGSGRWVVDYKTTTKAIGPHYFESYSPSTQLPGYAVAASIVFHEPVQGVIIDGMQIGVDFVRCGRGHILLGKEKSDEWMENAVSWVRSAMEMAVSAKIEPAEDIAAYAAKNAKHWPMNTESCFICPFKGVCSSTPSVRGFLLESDFVPGLWDPIARQGAKKKNIAGIKAERTPQPELEGADAE